VVKCFAVLRGIKKEENKIAVGETLSASHYLRNKCRHERIFKNLAVIKGLGLMIDVNLSEVDPSIATSMSLNLLCVMITTDLSSRGVKKL
jgi:hypothetical protein